MWFGIHLSKIQFGAKRSNPDKRSIRFDVKFYCPTNIKKQMLGCEKTKMVMTRVYPHHFFASVDQFRKFSASHTFEDACDRDVLRVKVTPYRRFPEG